VLKCFKTIDTILPNTAIVFVSHNMPMVSRICTQIILMENGLANFQGENVSRGIDLYFHKFMTNEDSQVVFTDNSIDLKQAWIEDVKEVNGLFAIPWASEIVLHFTIWNKNLVKTPFISLAIYDKEQRAVAEVIPDNQKFNTIEKDTEINFSVKVNKLYLSKGIYNITFTASEDIGFNVYYKIHKTVTLKIEHDKQIWTPFLLESELVEVKK